MSSEAEKKFAAIPPGLRTLIDQCQAIYPDQPNPLQVTTVLKYWLGGQDPLDYISMYSNIGEPERGIPPHWHYVSFGLSDLHGDGRVHVSEDTNKDDPVSGMGFELTFRLIKSSSGNPLEKPPTWPANLLQSLARYCFQTGNRLYAGDNVPWKRPLDGSNSKIQHLLIADDAQLARTRTPFGWVNFCQIVGVTDEELEQASQWNGRGVLNILKREVATGGEWLITDVRRSQSVFELFPEALRQLEDNLEKEGSDLAGINAEFTFREIGKLKFKSEVDSGVVMDKTAGADSKNDLLKFSTSNSLSSSLNKSYPEGYRASNVLNLDGIELTFAPYAVKFLVLAVKDRIRHGRHFTFKSRSMALTFVSESVTGSAVSKDHPYGVIGYWVQVLLPDELVPRMMAEFSGLKTSDEDEPKEYVFDFPDKNLRIIIKKSENIHGIMKAVAL